MIRRPPRSTQSRSSAASDVYKRQRLAHGDEVIPARADRLRDRVTVARDACCVEQVLAVAHGETADVSASTDVDLLVGRQHLVPLPRQVLGLVLTKALVEKVDEASSLVRELDDEALVDRGDVPVSYTHLTLPTIYSV